MISEKYSVSISGVVPLQCMQTTTFGFIQRLEQNTNTNISILYQSWIVRFHIWNSWIKSLYIIHNMQSHTRIYVVPCSLHSICGVSFNYSIKVIVYTILNHNIYIIIFYIASCNQILYQFILLLSYLLLSINCA